MSSPELRRVEVLARVKSKDLKLTDAAELMEVSYRPEVIRVPAGAGRGLKLAAGDEIHLGNARVAFQPDPTQTA
jgi:hypothetical protein